MAKFLLRPAGDRPRLVGRSEDEGLLLVEDFEGFPVGPLPLDAGAEADHHAPEPRGYRGRWSEGTRLTGREPGWGIVEFDGNQVLEQSIVHEGFVPVLACGDPDWTDVNLTARVRRLSGSPAGLVFRFVDGRSHYRLALEEARLVLSRVTPESSAELAEAPADSDDRFHLLSVELDGSRLRCRMDGEQLIELSDDALERGRVGVFACGPAQFDDVQVSCPVDIRRRLTQSAEMRARRREDCRRRLVRPQLVRRLSTEGFGTGKCLRFGDLDGDGRMEVVVPQLQRRGDMRTVGCLTALDLDGNILWRFGGPARRADAVLPVTDVPVQVFDLDGDGFDEVLVAREFHLHLLDGRTGELRKRVPCPPCAGPFRRTPGSGLFFADLGGRLRPGEVLLTDGAGQVWAFDAQLELMWHARCPAGGSVLAYDVDGDGIEEVLVGSTLLDAEGQEIWSVPFDDTVRCAAILPGDDGPRVAFAAGDEGLVLVDRNGRIELEDRSIAASGLAVGRFRLDVDGVQLWVSGRGDSLGVLALYDAAGNRLARIAAAPMAAAMEPVCWSADGADMLLTNAHAVYGGLLDSYGQTAIEFPDDGRPTLCCRAVEPEAGAGEQVVCWDADRVWFYAADRPADNAPPRRRALHNDSLFRAGAVG